jgi:hypothetical protein
MLAFAPSAWLAASIASLGPRLVGETEPNRDRIVKAT